MSVKSSLNRSIPGCVPVLGCCLPDPGYVGLGIPNMNRSFHIFTGGVPVPGSCLSGPGYVGLGISNANRPPPDPTGCALAPGNSSQGPGVWGIGNPYLGHFGLAPARGLESALLPQVRYDDVQADSSVEISISFGTDNNTTELLLHCINLHSDQPVAYPIP